MPHNNTSASSFHISCSWQSHNDVQRVRSIQSMKTDINQFNIYFYLFILASKKLHGGHKAYAPQSLQSDAMDRCGILTADENNTDHRFIAAPVSRRAISGRE